MKIVQAIGWYYPDGSGGTEVYVRALSRLLCEAGHEVVIAAPEPGIVRERTYTHDSTAVFRYPIPRQPLRDEVQGSVTVRGAESFHAWLASSRPDVVHMHTFVTGMGLPELRAAKQVGARTVVTTHSSSLGFVCLRGTLMQWGDRPCDGIVAPGKCAACALDGRGVPRPLARAIGHLPAPLARIASTMPGRVSTMLAMSDVVRRNLDRQREMLALADRYVVLTAGAREILRANAFGNGQIVVNPLGIDLNGAQAPAAAARDPRAPLKVGYVGRFDSIKGVELLAHALVSLPRDVPVTVEFRGPVQTATEQLMVERLKEIARDDRRIQFAPAIPHDEVADVLRQYDVLCCPSVCFEGGPTVALEAQAVGTPIIGSRIGGLIEIVTDDLNGRLIEPGNVSALAEVLRQAARDPALVARWRSKSRPPRSMSDVAQDYLRLYAS